MAEGACAALPAATAVVAALGLLGACADQSKLRESELTQLLGWLPGNYDNTAQADSDAQRRVQPPRDRIALIILKVHTPRLGHHVFYVQEMAAEDPRRVMSEKMFSFRVDEKRGIVETVYTFAEPLRWRDGQEHPELFTGVVADDVRSVPGCELSWKKVGEQFTATQDPKLCRDVRAASAESAAELTDDSLVLAGYRFRKTR
ncbi:MAG TPA: CpcT/CpeT family chromophore lyase [Steroidobacteraceae bacterium]